MSIMQQMKNFLHTASILWLLASVSGCASSGIGQSQAANAPDSPPQTSESELSMVGALPDKIKECHTLELQFVSEQVGWISCQNNLWRTSNGGRSWELVYSSQSTGERVNFYFADAQSGWSATLHTLLKTNDGGRTWKQLASPTPDWSKGAILSFGFLKDGKTGWLVGGVMRPIPPSLIGVVSSRYSIDDRNALTSAIYFTKDGGESWQLQEKSETIGTLMSDVYISDSQTVWAYGDTGIYNLEKDKWAAIDYAQGRCEKRDFLATLGLDENSSETDSPQSLYFADATHGWMSFSNGYVAKSEDGGRTWCDLLPPKALGGEPDPAYIQKLHFSDDRTGIALDNNGDILKTIDGGAHWSRVKTETKFDNLYFVDGQARLGGNERRPVPHQFISDLFRHQPAAFSDGYLLC